LNRAGEDARHEGQRQSSHCDRQWHGHWEEAISLASTDEGAALVLVIEAGQHSIWVNTVSPGATPTEELDQMIGALARRRGLNEEEVWKKPRVNNSPNRIAEAEDIALAVVFLASTIPAP
jgi:hypothetical protein